MVVPKRQYDSFVDASERAVCHVQPPPDAQGSDLIVELHNFQGTFGCIMLEPEACAYLTKLLVSAALKPMKDYFRGEFCHT